MCMANYRNQQHNFTVLEREACGGAVLLMVQTAMGVMVFLARGDKMMTMMYGWKCVLAGGSICGEC